MTVLSNNTFEQTDWQASPPARLPAAQRNR